MDQKKRWYVIQTKRKPGREMLFYLHQRKIKTYFPKRGKKPLFPSYVFAYCSKDEIYAARWISGVKRVLIENKNISPIYDISFLPTDLESTSI